MAKQNTALLLSRYIWLIDTISSAGYITRDEIDRRWSRSALSEGESEIPVPDVIIVWGSIVSEPIKRNLCYDVDNQNATSGYVCHIKKGEKDIVLLNTYHPAYSKYKDNGNLEKYVKEVFCI